MPAIEQRKLLELVARYKLEPSLQDVYVEGSDDAVVVRCALRELGIEGAQVFEIDSVAIESGRNGDNGNRARVIALAAFLDEQLGGTALRVACVIDGDLDYFLGVTRESDVLLRTDYTSIEMYFCSGGMLRRLGQRCLRAQRWPERVLEEFVQPTLQRLFAIRCVNARDEWHMTGLDFHKQVTLEGGQYRFDSDIYLHRYLSKNSRLADKESFQEAMDSIEFREDHDPRCFMHGHDFLKLVWIMMNEQLPRPHRLASSEMVFGLLNVSADYAGLAQEKLFVELARRLQAEDSG